MTSIGVCTDTSEAVELCESQGLFLKPIARLNISVQLPQLKSAGASISNWEVMEKLKRMIKPDEFLVLKVIKSTMEFVRFEGEVENFSKLKAHICQLDHKTIKLSGFTEALKVRAAEAKSSFPSRHDWESYFRDAKHMNEMVYGERPDTIHLSDLPCRWFANRKDKDRDVPSEFIVRKVFETFGEVRCIDIPMLDPYQKELTVSKGTIQTFSFGQDILFVAYIQFAEYISFVKAMTALRGMKLLYKGDDGKALTANMKTDFDKTQHLSEKSIRKRRLEREKLIRLEKEREERVQQEKEEEERKRAEERKRLEEEEIDQEKKREEKLRRREERRIDREERRRQEKLKLKRQEEERKMQARIALEERKILIARRKLETIRLLSDLFNRIKAIKVKEELERRELDLIAERRRQILASKQQRLEEERRRIEAEKRKGKDLERLELELRKKIMQKMKVMEEKREERQREELRRKVSSGSAKLKSAIVMKK